MSPRHSISFFAYVLRSTSDQMAAEAVAAVAAGCPALYVKVGDGLDEDERNPRAIRAAVGPSVPLRVDDRPTHPATLDPATALDALAANTMRA